MWASMKTVGWRRVAKEGGGGGNRFRMSINVMRLNLSCSHKGESKSQSLKLWKEGMFLQKTCFARRIKTDRQWKVWIVFVDLRLQMILAHWFFLEDIRCVYIVHFSAVRIRCHAFKFASETNGLCCMVGKVNLISRTLASCKNAIKYRIGICYKKKNVIQYLCAQVKGAWLAKRTRKPNTMQRFLQLAKEVWFKANVCCDICSSTIIYPLLAIDGGGRCRQLSNENVTFVVTKNAVLFTALNG